MGARRVVGRRRGACIYVCIFVVRSGMALLNKREREGRIRQKKHQCLKKKKNQIVINTKKEPRASLSPGHIGHVGHSENDDLLFVSQNINMDRRYVETTNPEKDFR